MNWNRLSGALRRWGTVWESWREARRRGGRPLPPQEAHGARVLLDAAIPEPALFLEPIRTVRSAFWGRIECYRDGRPFFRQEPFIAKIQHRDPEMVRAFGGDTTPHSGNWLLFYGPHWADHRPGGAPPVLLVPGAGTIANSVFTEGELVPALEMAGRAVFAIGFAHPHGDNWQQAEVLANAIARVKQITGASQVDLVAHSKGGVAARLYTSGMSLPGGTAYRKDVRRLILAGCPNNGIDMAFRHPMMFWYGSRFWAAPSPYLPPVRYSIYPGGAFPGQAQMVRDLRDVVPLGDPDFWNARQLYNGGLTLYGWSRGVDWTAAAGGRLIDTMNAAGTDPSVAVAVLAGNDPHLVIEGMPVTGETDGESDGLVLVPSALYTEGLVRRGAKLREAALMPLNHMDLVRDPQSVAWIAGHVR